MRIVDASNVTNRVLFASSDEKIFELMIRTAESWQRPALGKNILTDDRAPVELLSMKALDALIQRHLQHYKEIYRREGLDGILNSF